MKESTSTKIISGILISLGLIVVFAMVSFALKVLEVILGLFATIPSSAWGLKETTFVIGVLVVGIFITNIGVILGIGSMNVGIKKLKALESKKKIRMLMQELGIKVTDNLDDLLKGIGGNNGNKDKNKDSKGTSKRH